MRLGKKRPEERERKKNGKKMVNEEKRNIHDARQCKEEERGWRHLTIKMRLGERKSYEGKEL